MINKQSWIYAGKLKRHTIQLAHIPSTHKVYVRLNGITLYEETLKPNEQQHTFSFFVDDELCQITIERINNQYAYRFTNPENSTSATAKRRKLTDRLFIAGVLVVFVGIIGGLGAPFIYNYVRTQQLNKNLDMGGIVTTAYLQLQAPVNGKVKAAYTFTAGLERLNFAHTFDAQDSSLATLQAMFGKQDLLGVEVIYSPTKPQIHRLMPYQPSPAQIADYRQAARKTCLTLNLPNLPDTYPQTVFCDCLLSYFYTHYQLAGYARLYNAKTNATQNPAYNQATFAAFMQQDLPAQLQQICLQAAQGK